MNRFVFVFFGSQGIIPVVYGLFAVAFGIMNENKITNVFASAPTQCQKLIQQLGHTGRDGGVKAVAAPGGDPIDSCLNAAGWHETATFQPSYRYWDFQRIEAGIYLGLTVLAVVGTYWLVLRHDA